MVDAGDDIHDVTTAATHGLLHDEQFLLGLGHALPLNVLQNLHVRVVSASPVTRMILSPKYVFVFTFKCVRKVVVGLPFLWWDIRIMCGRTVGNVRRD